MPDRLARRTDPATSQLAAAGVNKHKCHIFALVAIRALERECGSCTALEAGCWAETHLGGMRESIRKRTTELHRAGRIERAGARPCKITGKMSATWRIAKGGLSSP